MEERGYHGSLHKGGEERVSQQRDLGVPLSKLQRERIAGSWQFAQRVQYLPLEIY